jgi:2-oxoglutarate dehydrogenase E2 component (dihydrolipoamide succinyltransferase)
MTADLRIPQLGESVTEGTIARWLKQTGDMVEAEEPVLELETDKATMEIPAGAAGQLSIVEPQGAVVRVGTVVARINQGAPTAARAAKAVPIVAPPRPSPPDMQSATTPPAGPALSPAVRKLVAEHALDPAQLSGSGKGGRLTKDDVLRHLEQPAPAPAGAPVPRPTEPRGADDARPPMEPSAPTPAMPPATPHPPEAETPERVPMSRLRRRIAERLVEAQRTAAILTTFNEVDLSALLAARRRHREAFRERHGVDLGLMSLFGRACVGALRVVPVVNAQIDGADIVYHRQVHLGIAVSTERGLVVPVIRGADSLGLPDLERRIEELARRAREGKITPDELSGGTFTITNGGVFGSLLSTPILNPPQSGILGMHKIEDRPVAVDGQVVIRPMMYLALSYDHRLVDGAQAVTFLVRVKECLEDPVRMLLEV